MDVDLVMVQDHEGLVAELRALKAMCGKSTTQIAADAGLSTSGIEGMLAGANFPTEETVRRFVEACGETSPRPWLDARIRAAAARPKAPGVREELEALRIRNAELAAEVAVLGQRVAVLEAGQLAVGDRALTYRLARLLQPKLTDLPRIMGWDAPPANATGRYNRISVNEVVQEIRDLLRQGDPMELLLYLAAAPASLHQLPWEADAEGYWGCQAGFDVTEVDDFLGGFRAAVEEALNPNADVVQWLRSLKGTKQTNLPNQPQHKHAYADRRGAREGPRQDLPGAFTCVVKRLVTCHGRFARFAVRPPHRWPRAWTREPITIPARWKFTRGSGATGFTICCVSTP